MINQYDNNPAPEESALNIGTIQLAGKLIISLIGLAITLFGIKYSLDIFLIIYNYLQNPSTLTTVIEEWIVLLNIKGFIVDAYPVDKLLAITILAIGALLLLRISLGFIQVGTTLLVGSINNGSTAKAAKISIPNLNYKLSKLKTMADQGAISKQAYEDARDKYLVQNMMED